MAGKKATEVKGSPGVTFERQRTNDRAAIQKCISKFVDNPKSRKITNDQRWPMWMKLREEVLEDREKFYSPHRKTFRFGTARQIFPRQYDEKKELEWLQSIREGWYLAEDENGVRGADEDDPEDLPGTDMGLNKTEVEEDAEEDRKQNVSNRVKQEAGYEIDEEDDKGPKKPVICKVVSRGFPVKIGTTGPENGDGDAGLAEGNQTGSKAARGVERRWKWMGMKMAVWPPFESADGKHEITGSHLKRTLDGASETSGRKRARP